MAQMRPSSALALLASALLVGGLWLVFAPQGVETPSYAEPPAGESVELTLSIHSPDDGLALEAKRRIPRGSTALDAMQGTVAMEVKEYAGIGFFVTRLCGIAPPAGKFWSPAVDGKKSQVGIAALKLDRDLRLEWTIKDVE
jgi:hypothetical protein